MKYYMKPKYKVGDKVRLYRERSLFENDIVGISYTDEIFNTKKVKTHVPKTLFT